MMITGVTASGAWPYQRKSRQPCLSGIEREILTTNGYVEEATVMISRSANGEYVKSKQIIGAKVESNNRNQIDSYS